MERYVYQKQIVPAGYECDTQNRLKLSFILRQMQQVSSQQLDELGLSYEYLKREGFVFLLSGIGLKITRLPKNGEALLLETEPMASKGVQLLRTVDFYTLSPEKEKKEKLIEAQSAWVLAEPETHRLLRPSQFFHPLHRQARTLEQDWISACRIRTPQTAEKVGEREVRYSDLDCNGHLNNAVYADVVCDFLPDHLLEQKEPKEFYLVYRREVLLHQMITVQRQEREDGFDLCGSVNRERSFEARIVF